MDTIITWNRQADTKTTLDGFTQKPKIYNKFQFYIKNLLSRCAVQFWRPSRKTHFLWREFPNGCISKYIC